MMEMYPGGKEYLSNHSDEEIENMIKNLAPNQKKIFEDLCMEINKRKALWMATSWPMEE